MYCTAHYRLYSTARRPALMSAMPGFLEAAHEHYIKVTGLADLPGDAPLPVYMLAQRQQWAHFTEQLVRENLNIYLSIDAGGYCYHGTCVFWDVGGLGTMSLAAHECLHQFFARHNARLPIWLEEGLCVSAEGFDLQNGGVVFDPKRNLLRMSCLRNALVAGRWIDIEQLVSMDGGDAVQNPRPGAAAGILRGSGRWRFTCKAALTRGPTCGKSSTTAWPARSRSRRLLARPARPGSQRPNRQGCGKTPGEGDFPAVRLQRPGGVRQGLSAVRPRTGRSVMLRIGPMGPTRGVRSKNPQQMNHEGHEEHEGKKQEHSK